MQIALPGQPLPLGATVDADGANFSIASATAEAATLCLIDSHGREEQVTLRERDFGVWHGYVPGVRAGQRYGYRVDGPADPARGLRFDPSRLLVDPYARAIDQRPGTDSTGALVSLAVDDAFDWSGDVRPGTPLADSVIYELHVKGFTARHPGIPEEIRGTYAGLAHPAALEHLVDLGVTAVELLPVPHHLTEPAVRARGLVNYWGYNTLGFFAPHAGYSASVRSGNATGVVAEFKQMVRALHGAGIEVILDVVYNHTCEGGADGPTISFRGIDNLNYYRLDPDDRAAYVDTTGCGNCLNTDSVIVLRMIMDSLRTWVEQMHVDGFRFDLAATLGRRDGTFSRTSPFFDCIAQDPILSTVKLIAEPWDVGQPDSYDIGRFPALWSEWNGSYRDTVRDYWRSTAGLLPRFATRITGSSDLYGGSLRRPSASVNFVTAHDGFTLRDLVSYDAKHNQANGEGNRDGTDANYSWNRGVEGPTDDPAILDARSRAQRTMLTTLLTSFGVPMLLAGDELGRTQQGNNNAYCQDNGISWLDWSDIDHDLLAFTRRLIALRRAHPALRRRRFLTGAQASQVDWFTPAGVPMSQADWANPDSRAVAVYLDGQDDPDVGPDGRPLLDDDLLLCMNAWWEPIDFTIPMLPPVNLRLPPVEPTLPREAEDTSTSWTIAIDTAERSSEPPAPTPSLAPGGSVRVAGRSMVVLLGSRTHIA
ncbi:MAG: glycogen debranching protein GlgX [Actinomycetales bacterium]|nr:glycogen debranching protein GlgX [Actinomycetales bacterium]